VTAGSALFKRIFFNAFVKSKTGGAVALPVPNYPLSTNLPRFFFS
jgi:hypothetical protein